MTDSRLLDIRAIITDVDGVLTDGRILLIDDREAKFFSIRDGLAMKVANDSGLHIALLTGRASLAVSKRASELGLKIVKNGRLDKQLALNEILSELGLTADCVAYVGDDLPDLAPMSLARLSFCPSDAAMDVLDRADVVVPVQGGHGVLRWVIEEVMRAQGRWSRVVDRFGVSHA